MSSLELVEQKVVAGHRHILAAKETKKRRARDPVYWFGGENPKMSFYPVKTGPFSEGAAETTPAANASSTFHFREVNARAGGFAPQQPTVINKKGSSRSPEQPERFVAMFQPIAL
ncbi:MAG: hypothetical protein ACF788_06365 [Novipirellula sp. JB048]